MQQHPGFPAPRWLMLSGDKQLDEGMGIAGVEEERGLPLHATAKFFELHLHNTTCVVAKWEDDCFSSQVQRALLWW